MALRVVQLGTPRRRSEGLRIGTVRHLPRGVRKQDYARLDYFDVWLPELAPGAALVQWARSQPLVGSHWASFGKRYRREMSQPAAARLIALLAALSRQTNISVGCYCEDSNQCHRSILKDLLVESGAKIATQRPAR